MNLPLVSVVIPNYNYGRYLAEAVESVLRQSYENLELLVVDDGSTDHSLDVLASFRGRLRVIEQANGGPGPARARNLGVSESRGEYIAFLDSDDRWLPEKVEQQIELFLKHPGLGLVHCGVEEFDEEGRVLGARLDGREGWLAEQLLLGETSILGGGSAAMVSRSAYDRLRGFDTRLSISEDFDFYFRLAQEYRIGFLPSVLVQKRVHNSSAQWGSDGIERIERDMLLLFREIFDGEARRFAGKRLRSRAYGRLHRVLCGGYYGRGEVLKCFRHGLMSLWHSPREGKYIVAFPLRRLKGRSAG